MEVIRTRKNSPASPVVSGGNEAGIPGVPGVTPPASQEKTASDAPDGTFDRLLKLVPSEVVAGYTALLAIAAAATGDAVEYAIPVGIVACSILLVLALRRAGQQMKPPQAPPTLQYVFSMAAFWTWAFAIEDPLEPFGYHVPQWITAFGCVLVPLFGSFVIDIADNRAKGTADGPTQ